MSEHRLMGEVVAVRFSSNDIRSYHQNGLSSFDIWKAQKKALDKAKELFGGTDK